MKLQPAVLLDLINDESYLDDRWKSLDSIQIDYDLCLLDCEAGIEQVNRRTVHRIDKLVLVSDTSRRGIEALAQVRDLAVKYNAGAPLEVLVIVNRVCSMEEEDRARETAESLGLDIVAFVPEDPNVRRFNSKGIPLVDLPDDSLAVVELSKIDDLLVSLAPCAA